MRFSALFRKPNGEKGDTSPFAPVAQLDRAADYESAGYVFKSRRARANFADSH